MRQPAITPEPASTAEPLTQDRPSATELTRRAGWRTLPMPDQGKKIHRFSRFSWIVWLVGLILGIAIIAAHIFMLGKQNQAVPLLALLDDLFSIGVAAGSLLVLMCLGERVLTWAGLLRLPEASTHDGDSARVTAYRTTGLPGLSLRPGDFNGNPARVTAYSGSDGTDDSEAGHGSWSWASRYERAGLIEGGIAALGTGWALWSCLLIVLGLAGFLTGWAMIAACTLVIAVGQPWHSVLLRPILSNARELGHHIGTEKRKEGQKEILVSLPLAWLVGLAALVMVGALLYALAPPTSNDALIYHLTGPSLFWQAGRIGPQAFVPLANMPMATEMLYLIPIIVGAPAAAQLIHWACALLIALTLVAFGQWLYPHRPTAGPMAAAIFLLTPMVSLLAGWAFIDLALTWQVTLCLYAACQWLAVASYPDLRTAHQQSGVLLPAGWAVIAGVAGGLALATKYTALFPVALVIGAMGLLALHRVFGGRRWGSARARWSGVAQVVVALVVMLAIAAPWYARNWRWFGNPLYPLSVAGTLHAAAPVVPSAAQHHIAIGENNAESAAIAQATGHKAATGVVPQQEQQGQQQEQQQEQQGQGQQQGAQTAGPAFGLGTAHTWQAYLRLPWDVLTDQKRFSTFPPAPFSPFFVLALLGLWGARRWIWPALLGAMMLGGFAFWAIGYPDIRYYLPYVPLWCLLSGGGLAGLLSPAMHKSGGQGAWLRRLRRVVVVPLVLVAALGIAMIDWSALLFHNGDGGRAIPIPDALAVDVGMTSPQSYLIRHVANERAVLALNALAPVHARVLFLWNDRVFWVKPQVLPIPDQGGNLTLLRAADALATHGHRPFVAPDGATYVLVSKETALYFHQNGWSLNPGTLADFAAFDDVARRRLTRLYQDDAFSLYSVGQPASQSHSRTSGQG